MQNRSHCRTPGAVSSGTAFRPGAAVFAAAAALLFLAAGCGGNGGSGSDGARSASEDVIRVDLGVYAPGRIPGGIGEPNKVALELADEWTAQHPDLRVKYQTMVNTGTSEGEWLKTQLLGGMAPEIIQQNAESVWPDVEKGWYVPLDEYLEQPNPYIPGNKRWLDSFQNQDLMNAKRAPDGKLYCISLDVVETGIFYNRTLLDELGVGELPETWDGLMQMLDRISRHPEITPMTSGGNLGSDWGQDILFEMLYHDILPQMDLIPSRPDAEGYLGHYLEPVEAGFLFTKGFFTPKDPRWREMNRLLKEWRQYWAAELKNSDPTRLFLTGRLALYWDGSWFIRRMVTDPYVDFEWGITYIPRLTGETTPFASATPATVIGGAAMQYHITNSARLNGTVDECVDYLMFISAPQNVERLASEALLFIPNVNGAEMDERLEPFEEIFQRRYCAIKWLDSMDGKYKKYWRRMLDYYLNDGVPLDEYLVLLEENFRAWVESHRGRGSWDFSKLEPVWREREARLRAELGEIL